jgi:hypothetical protein
LRMRARRRLSRCPRAWCAQSSTRADRSSPPRSRPHYRRARSNSDIASSQTSTRTACGNAINGVPSSATRGARFPAVPSVREA